MSSFYELFLEMLAFANTFMMSNTHIFVSMVFTNTKWPDNGKG